RRQRGGPALCLEHPELPDPGGHADRCPLALGCRAAPVENRKRLLAAVRRAGPGSRGGRSRSGPASVRSGTDADGERPRAGWGGAGLVVSAAHFTFFALSSAAR